MKVLIADDEKNIRTTLAQILSLDGFETTTAENGLSAQKRLQEERFDAVVIDLRMPGMDGLQLLAWLNESGPQIPSIVISAHGEVRDAVEAMKGGAFDYVTKPFEPEDVAIRLRRAIEDDRIRREVLPQRDTSVDRSTASSPDDDSRNPAMRSVLAAADRVAPSNSTVLITGESGTGKEVLARRIHDRSDRTDRPFVAINVGAIPESLIESELFGHEKGAFTGAISRRAGPFESAAGGTLFLDEIGELPIHLQVKLLRVLQERTIQRIGGTTPIPIDVRIVAATNRDLRRLIEEGTFREDLYYRLNVIELHIPPLRERREDIGPLIGVFLERLARRGRLAGREHQRVTGISPEAVRLLQRYQFPGNIRELENIIERTVLLTDNPELSPSDFDYLNIDDASTTSGVENTVTDADTGEGGLNLDGPITLDRLEEAAIRRALLRNDGHRERTAQELGISRRTLLNKMKEYGVSEWI